MRIDILVAFAVGGLALGWLVGQLLLIPGLPQ